MSGPPEYLKGDTVRIISSQYGMPESYKSVLWTVVDPQHYNCWPYIWLLTRDLDVEFVEFKVHQKHITHSTVLDLMAEV